MATICDCLSFFCRGELKHEVVREVSLVSLDGSIECLGWNAVQFGRVGTDHCLLPAKGKHSSRQGGVNIGMRLEAHEYSSMSC